MNSETYYVFITALISSYEDMIIAALVKRGFQISPLSETNEVTLGGDDSISALIALRVDAEKRNSLDLLDEIKIVLKELKVLYYSVIVTESVDCAWDVSNTKLPKNLPPPPMLNVIDSDPSLN